MAIIAFLLKLFVVLAILVMIGAFFILATVSSDDDPALRLLDRVFLNGDKSANGRKRRYWLYLTFFVVLILVLIVLSIFPELVTEQGG